MNELKDIIASLERQKAGIDRALSALTGIETSPQPASSGSSTTKAQPGRKRGLTAAGRKRISEALKKRWAAKKASEAGSGESVEPKPQRRRARKRSARKQAPPAAV
jgi:hypothetical protein